MPAYYADAVRAFVAEATDAVVGKLSRANANAHFLQYADATLVWGDTIEQLRTVLLKMTAVSPNVQEWGVILEYPIPRRQKRIDLVLLAPEVAFVIEFKTKIADRAAVEQVEDYAMDLRDFHQPSANLKLIPIVVSKESTPILTPDARKGQSAYCCSFGNLHQLLIGMAKIDDRNSALGIELWNKGAYKPVPPIVQAAQAIFGGMEVREVAHAHAGEENLTRTVDTIYSIVQDCRTQKLKAAVFVTGIPGSGKTLAGLRAVHDPRLAGIAGAEATFLSGNGPLVNVLREALVRDFRKRLQTEKRARKQKKSVQEIGAEKFLRTPSCAPLSKLVDETLEAERDHWNETKKKVERKVRTLIESVHVFAKENYERDDAPNNHVIVFDEAQRAWNAARNERKFKRAISEPEMLLRIMGRHDWAVIIALVGGGQEINDGEAGLIQWGSALMNLETWDIFCSPYVLSENVEDRFRLTENGHKFDGRLQQVSSLHLDVGTRAIQARNISQWVDAVLQGDVAAARALGISPPITRNLSDARKWIIERRIEPTRSGLVASAWADRLRVDGLEVSYEFHSNFEWPLWFLNPAEDVRSSSKLEIVATQFEVQGLELDWVGVCWSEDLVWTGDKWESNNFNHYHWKLNSNDEKHRFRLNAYRVLLTRARRGMVIYVPNPTRDDSTRLANELDSTFDFLVSAGAKPI